MEIIAMRTRWLTMTFVFLVGATLHAQKPKFGSAWEMLRAHHDKNQDGKVSKEEYQRGGDKFQRLDRNKDGFLTEADFASSGRRGRRGRPDRARFRKLVLARILGVNRGGSMELSKLDAWFEKMDANKDGILSSKESGMGRRGRMIRILDSDQDGDVQKREIVAAAGKADTNKDGRVTGVELGARERSTRPTSRPPRPKAPEAGQLAPDFTLMSLDGKKKQTLSSFRGKRPVALIFGSYT